MGRIGGNYGTGNKIYYMLGKGGKICDLPPRYLDRLTKDVLHATPWLLPIRIMEELISGKFIRSYNDEALRLYLSCRKERRSNGNKHERRTE